MNRVPGLYISYDSVKGRGVYTSIPISRGDLIEICPVIIIPAIELPIIHKTTLHDYYFLWGEDQTQCAIALGYGSLYNHQINGAAQIIMDYENETIDFEALRDITAGEEITINYNGEQGDNSPMWWDK